jgi:Transposase DDE domain
MVMESEFCNSLLKHNSSAMTNANINVLEAFKETIEIVGNNKDLRFFVLNDQNAFTRDRKANFSTVTYLVLGMLKKSLNIELKTFFEKLSIPASMQFTKGAFSQRRHKINGKWFKFLLEHLAALFYGLSDQVELWKGYKLIAIDGSSAILINESEVSKIYKGAKNKYGTYPLCRFMKMYDVLNNITLKVEMMNMQASERKCAYDWVDKLPSDSFTLFDRGFPSFTLFFLMQACEIPKQFICRCKIDFSNSIKQFIASTDITRRIRFYPDNRAIQLLTKYGYKVANTTYVELRAEKIFLQNGEIELLVTSILDEDFLSNDEIKALYNKRWGIETAIGIEKNLLQLENYSSHLLNGIEQDFYASFIANNIHSMICKEAQKDVNKIMRKNARYARQINISASLYAFKASLIKIFYSRRLKNLLIKLEREFREFTEPIRPNRKVQRKKTCRRRYGKHQTQKNYRMNM